MADKIFIHLVSSKKTDVKFTKKDGGNIHTIKASDADKKAANAASVKPLLANDSKKRSIQIGLSPAVGKQANAVIKLYAVRGGPGATFSAKPPTAGKNVAQRLIARIEVVNGQIDMASRKVKVRESLPPRPHPSHPSQNDHRPKAGHSRRFNLSKTAISGGVVNPTPLPGVNPPQSTNVRPGFQIVHGDARINFSPEVA